MRNESAVRISRRWVRFVVIAIAAASIGLALHARGADDQGPCVANAQSRELDYWLGDWTVGGPGASASATSNVFLTLDQCVVIEKWDGGRGHRGENMFAYSADNKSWDGMFADNEGRVHSFVNGKVARGVAEFSGTSAGTDGKDVLNRVRIVRDGPDKVEQIWEKSSDNGVTWTTEYRGEYLRKKS